MRAALEKINIDVMAEAEQKKIEWRFSPKSAHTSEESGRG